MPVHVYGNICNIEKIQKIADKYNLKVVYTMLRMRLRKHIRGKMSLPLAMLLYLVFMATKVFHSIEGGAVSTSNPELYERLYALKNFGIQENGLISNVGANAKMKRVSGCDGALQSSTFSRGNSPTQRSCRSLYAAFRRSKRAAAAFSTDGTSFQIMPTYPVIFEKEFGSIPR